MLMSGSGPRVVLGLFGEDLSESHGSWRLVTSPTKETLKNVVSLQF
jgi:hypothetical protein